MASPQQAVAAPTSDQPVTVSPTPVENTPEENTSAFVEAVNVVRRNCQNFATVPAEIPGEDDDEPFTLDVYSVDVNMEHVSTLSQRRRWSLNSISTWTWTLI